MKKAAALLLTVLVMACVPSSATAAELPRPPQLGIPIPGGDCKQAPTADIPGQGITGFFAGRPDKIPAPEDPFRPDAKTTVYEQYGYAGLRWTTYDLGCGPDAVRNPDAIVGNAIANWMMQVPLALSALTGSLTKFAFHPSFLGTFDPIIMKVSQALNDSLFSAWVPMIIALTGGLIVLKAKRAALASTAAAIGWSLFVVLLATAVIRWPIAAGHVVDQTVTQTLGATISKMDGGSTATDPGTTVASNIQAAILYRGWVAGEFGSADSATAKKYGPQLFRASALNWAEREQIEKDARAARAFTADAEGTALHIAFRHRRRELAAATPDPWGPSPDGIPDLTQAEADSFFEAIGAQRERPKPQDHLPPANRAARRKAG